MAKSTWQAHYFSGSDAKAPATRILLIEADSETDAGKLAIAQMGRSRRVDVVRALWEAPTATTRSGGRVASLAAGLGAGSGCAAGA